MTVPGDLPVTQTRPAGQAAKNPAMVLLAVAACGWVFAAADYWVYTISYALVVAVAALGLMVVVGWGREISLAQGALLGTSVYLFGFLYRSRPGGWGWPFLVAAIAAIVAVAMVMAVVALVGTKLPGVYVMVLTLGLQFLLETTVFTNRRLAGGIVAIATPRPRLFGLGLESDRVFYFFLLGSLCAVLLLLARLRRSRFGRALLLVGASRQAAASVGVPPWRYKVFAFLLSGVLAGAAGVLSAMLFRSVPGTHNYTAFSSLFLLAIPVLAGFDATAAVVAVALAFGLVPQALERFHVNVLLLGGLGVVAGIMLGPRGIAGRAEDLWRRFRRDSVQARRAAHRQSSAASTDAGQRRTAAVAAVKAYLPVRDEVPVALSVSGVSVRFGGVQALNDVSLVVPAGSFVGLIGPNGAGKTTLFDVISGLKPRDHGTIELFGEDVTALPAWDRARLGMTRTFQSARVIPDVSVADNLLVGTYLRSGERFAPTLAGLPGAWSRVRQAEEAAWAVAQLLEIDVHWKEPVGRLHFSARRRVEIGRALLSGPRLVLLDEPAAGLDPFTTAKLFRLVKELHQELNLTVLLVEHYVRAVFESCDTVHVLDGGRILASGPPAAIVDHPEVRLRYLGRHRAPAGGATRCSN